MKILIEVCGLKPLEPTTAATGEAERATTDEAGERKKCGWSSSLTLERVVDEIDRERPLLILGLVDRRASSQLLRRDSAAI